MSNTRPVATVRYDNQDRVVIVTGGASGIGRSVAVAFAESGARVACLDVQAPKDDAFGDHPVRFIRCDTSQDADCEAAVEEVIEAFGGVDVLVNNAAIQPKESYHPIHEIDSATWERMVRINFGGYMRMARAVIPTMRTQHSGVIVNMASGQAHRTAREVGVYGPIKSGNVMQARQWGIEYARDGIRVLSVSPGAIDTPMVRATLEAQGGAESLANRHPLGRIGQPEEVANAVLWLSSDDASFITATDLEVDGGLGSFGAFADPYETDSMPKSFEGD